MCLSATHNIKYISGAICYLSSLNPIIESVTSKNGVFSPIASLHQSYSHFIIINLHFGHNFLSDMTGS